MNDTRSAVASAPLDHMTDAVIVMDVEGRIVDWPSSAEALFGWARTEAVGRLAASLLIPNRFRDAFSETLDRLVSPCDDSLVPHHMEVSSLDKSGEEFLLDFTVTRLEVEGKRFLFGQARNLSDSRRREEHSSRQSVQFQLHNHTAALSSVGESLQASLTKSLDTLCSIAGWPAGIALALDYSDRTALKEKARHVAGDDRLQKFQTDHPFFQAPCDRGFLGRIWKSKEPAWTQEFHNLDPFCTPGLSDLGFRAAFGLPVLADEEIVAVLVFFAWEKTVPDSNMRMLIENLCEQLGRVVERSRWIEERARLAAIVDSSYDAIISKDLQGRIISWNQGAEQTYGYAAEEVLGQSARLLLPEGMEEEESSVADVVSTGHRLKLFETRRRCKDGSIIDVALTVSPIRDSRGRIVGASSIERNVTFPKQREKELRLAKRDAEKANQAKSEFLANISHELRTPMNAILGMVNLSLGEELSDVMRDYLTTAYESAQTLLYLLNDLLDFSRMSAGHLELENEPFRLRETLDTAMKSLSIRASEKGLELACQINKHVPHFLRGDAMRLRQVIVNLAGNAIKFTDQGEVVVDVRALSQRNSEVFLQFSVRDTGIGIPQEDQQKIFSPFTQVDASTTRNETGSGLGLAIVRELVGKMGGTVGLESEPGRGSHFYFTVPFEILPDANAAPHSTELVDLPVLVVDDNRTNQMILEESLSNWSMRPTVVGSAKAALEGAAKSRGRRTAFSLVDRGCAHAGNGRLPARRRAQRETAGDGRADDGAHVVVGGSADL